MESPERRIKVSLNGQKFSFAVQKSDTLASFLERLRPKVSADLVSDDGTELQGALEH